MFKKHISPREVEVADRNKQSMERAASVFGTLGFVVVRNALTYTQGIGLACRSEDQSAVTPTLVRPFKIIRDRLCDGLPEDHDLTQLEDSYESFHQSTRRHDLTVQLPSEHGLLMLMASTTGEQLLTLREDDRFWTRPKIMRLPPLAMLALYSPKDVHSTITAVRGAHAVGSNNVTAVAYPLQNPVASSGHIVAQ